MKGAAGIIILAIFLMTAWGSVSAAPRKGTQPNRAAAKKNTKPLPTKQQKTLPTQVAPTGKEEKEIAAPSPASKLPKREYKNLDISKNPTLGTFTIGFSAGLYNFTTRTENSTLKTTRTYTLDSLDITALFGLDLAFRLGKDSEDNHDSKTGFHYYRSNRGIFTDFEIGMKTQKTEEKPTRFNYTESSPSGTTTIPVDTGYDPTKGFSAIKQTNLTNAGISQQLRQSVGSSATEVTMVYASAYYHLTPLNFLLNFGSAFRWFDASVGPSLRVWYYRDYADPVRQAVRNDDLTYSTFMIAYRQYIQFHPKVRLSTRFYFPALTYFTQMAKSGRFNENEYILNATLDIYALRFNEIGLIISVGYEGHWWYTNPYSSDRFVRTGFVNDSTTDAHYAGYEHKDRTSWEAFATIAIDYHFMGN
ncbi:MAG TPA: hypothetical protein PLY93_00910 [Turneriella sp.]|nr:hypothetical protein [Turneriella sp.]